MVRALRELGASRVRIADVEVLFGAPYVSVDVADEARDKRERTAEELREDDLYRSAP